MKQFYKLININDITPELLHKFIHKIELQENKGVIIHYHCATPFLSIEAVTSSRHMWIV